jgi:predicted dinucleotide-binding enzyme
MATLGLIGSGHIGGTLARLAVDAGLDVVLSNSRGPHTLSDLVDELGPQARAATPAQAAAAVDWVVVKAFNNIHYPHLRALPRPVDAAGRTALPIARDDPGAKKQAAELLSLLGYDSVDMGPLAEGWRSQLGTPVFCAPYAVTEDEQYRTQPAAPASAAEVRVALASARR